MEGVGLHSEIGGEAASCSVVVKTSNRIMV